MNKEHIIVNLKKLYITELNILKDYIDEVNHNFYNTKDENLLKMYNKIEDIKNEVRANVDIKSLNSYFSYATNKIINNLKFIFKNNEIDNERKMLLSYELGEIAESINSDLTVIDNILHEDTSHKFIIDKYHEIEEILIKHNLNKDDYFVNLQKIIKNKNFDEVFDYLNNIFVDWELVDLLNNEQDLYIVLENVENILLYWTNYKNLLK